MNLIIKNIKYTGILGIPSNKTPGNSVELDKSGWRIEKPEIDYDKCVSCKKCYIVCPDIAIFWDDVEFPVITYSLCKGCGICANECPVKAIKMVKE